MGLIKLQQWHKVPREGSLKKSDLNINLKMDSVGRGS